MEAIRRRGELPPLGRAPTGAWGLVIGDELLRVQGIQMLPHRHRRHVQACGQLLGVQRAFLLEEMHERTARPDSSG